MNVTMAISFTSIKIINEDGGFEDLISFLAICIKQHSVDAVVPSKYNHKITPMTP
jgi:hypothetical protein